MNKFLLFTILYFLFLIINSYALQNKASDDRNKTKDSLLTLVKTDKPDTNKLSHLNKLSGEYVNIGSYDSAMFYANSALKLSNSILNITNNPKVKLTSKKNKAFSLNNKGNVYWYQGNYPEALKNYIASLKIYEEISDKSGIASSYYGIAFVYSFQSNYSEALKNYFPSLKIYEEIGDKKGIADSYNGIGIVYSFQKNYPEALRNYFASLEIRKEIGDIKGIAASLGNIGIIYKDQGNYSEALKNFFICLKTMETINNKIGIADSYCNIGDAYTKQRKYKEAEKYLNMAKELSKEIGAKEYLRETYNSLTKLDSAKGNYKGAFENHKLYFLYRDSLNNEEANKKTIQSQMNFDFEKKQAIANTEHKKELEKQSALAEEKSRKQNLVILFVVVGLLLVIIFASIILHSLKITRKQKNTIEKQKQIVDEKNMQLSQQNEEIRTQRDEIETQRDQIIEQRDIVTIQKENLEKIHKEVTDSINYAKRIQDAVLPVSETARKVLGEHFILFKPKDVVSGDFYLTIQINKWIMITVADCTGHGVPGAFMSMLGISFLTEIVRKVEITQASQVLNELRKEIINALQQKGLQGEQKDGMDISLLVVNSETKECQWAGANNPLYIVSSRQEALCSQLPNNCQLSSADCSLFEVKGDKMPIAIHPVMSDFTNHQFKAEKGDCLYLFSDGFADQFGGPKGKKFMYKKFKQLLIENCKLTMQEQKEILENNIIQWIGNGEQVDDITLLGIKI